MKEIPHIGTAKYNGMKAEFENMHYANKKVF